jgi:hypothetical protein
MALANILSFYWGFSAKITCIWLSVWLFRRKAEVDYPLGPSDQILRWAVVALGFAIGYLPGSNLGYVRLGGSFLGLAFLCWPNFAYHLRNLFRRGTQEPAAQPSIRE